LPDNRVEQFRYRLIKTGLWSEVQRMYTLYEYFTSRWCYR